MTFAPAQQITAAMTALALHGVELPAVPTRMTVPEADLLLIDLDVSKMEPAQVEALTSVLPGRVSKFAVGHTAVFMLVTTEVNMILFTDQEKWQKWGMGR